MGEIVAYSALLGMAVLPILSGAHMSLKMPAEAKKRLRAHQGKKQKMEGEDDDEEEEEEIIDRLTTSDALAFPILGSIVLFGLYLAFQYLSKVWINRIIGGYMSVIGVAATARLGVAVVQLLMPEKRWTRLTIWKLSLYRNKAEYGTTSANVIHLLAVVLAVGLAVSQHYQPHWIVANLLALSFAFNAISLLRIDSFFTGSLLLSLLFVYDIWWVFGSKAVFGADVMVKVATNLDAPIKITFPRNLAAGTGFSLLGLGDIVLPGIYIALALRYDYHRALKTNPPPTPSSAFARPYFLATLGAYLIGLVTTIWVMHTFRAAQPALLYLSPACISSVVLCALVRGELAEVWTFDDASDDNDGGGKGKKGEDTGALSRANNIVDRVDDGSDKKVDGGEKENDEREVAESTSIEVEGHRVLRSRVVKQ